jgi:hypothetical protein
MHPMSCAVLQKPYTSEMANIFYNKKTAGKSPGGNAPKGAMEGIKALW